ADGVPCWTITGSPTGSPASWSASTRPSGARTVRVVIDGRLRRSSPVRRVLEPRRPPAGVDRVQRRAGRNDLVDRVEHLAGERNVGGAELALELLHRPRADDRRGDRGMAEHEGECQMHEAETGLLGERGNPVDRLELELVARKREVVARRNALRATAPLPHVPAAQPAAGER